MFYTLRYDAAAATVHDALPPASSEALTEALARTCEDPIGATEPYGHDDGVMRMVVTERAFAVVLVGHATKRITVLRITYLA
ncbi:hypothetical protein [Streptomyces hoynatensis]|uniref:Type II toxin-antitoxin system RelE/ParE family toxin n=1 Tax=Streptomyces hoynatensis TaxID=1141874 RepID=A0A3A9YYJ2_9ACTN|nr:hypothetical protein [Streptomyces hoynatensis]RKN40774.1 hypothetical protein D7294_16930 [Streptomyces hoynatensis]